MIAQNATVTSKMQLTIPIRIATKIGLKPGEKVQVVEKDGQIVITPVKQQLAELDGVVVVPGRWQGKDVDTIIQEARQEHLQIKS